MFDVERIRITFTDESTDEFSGRMYKCTADRLAFERHYGFTSASRIGQIPEGAERLISGERFDELSEEEQAEQIELARRISRAAGAIPEEYTVFYVWRCWSRAHQGAGQPLLEFGDRLGGIEFIMRSEVAPEGDGADPLATAARAAS